MVKKGYKLQRPKYSFKGKTLDVPDDLSKKVLQNGAMINLFYSYKPFSQKPGTDGESKYGVHLNFGNTIFIVCQGSGIATLPLRDETSAMDDEFMFPDEKKAEASSKATEDELMFDPITGNDNGNLLTYNGDQLPPPPNQEGEGGPADESIGH